MSSVESLVIAFRPPMGCHREQRQRIGCRRQRAARPRGRVDAAPMTCRDGGSPAAGDAGAVAGAARSTLDAIRCRVFQPARARRATNPSRSSRAIACAKVSVAAVDARRTASATVPCSSMSAARQASREPSTGSTPCNADADPRNWMPRSSATALGAVIAVAPSCDRLTPGASVCSAGPGHRT